MAQRKNKVKVEIRLGLWVTILEDNYPYEWCVQFYDSTMVIMTKNGEQPTPSNTVQFNIPEFLESCIFLGYGKYRMWRKHIPFFGKLIRPYSKSSTINR